MQEFLNNTVILIQLSALILSIVLIILVSKRVDKQVHAANLMLVFLLLNSYGLFLFVSLKAGIAGNLWFLYRTGLPPSMLVPAVAYLYCRSILLDENRLKWKDSFHLIPFLIAIVQYLPYYLSPIDQKKQLVSNLSGITDELMLSFGYLPENQFAIIRGLILLFYAYLIMTLIFNKNYRLKQITKEEFKLDKKINSWIKIFCISFSFNSIAIALYFFLQFIQNQSSENLFLNILGFAIAIIFNGTLIYYSSYLILNPETLIGLYQSSIKKNPKTKETPRKDDFSEIIEAIKMEFEINRIHLNTAISIEKLAILIGQPSRITSYVINNHFGINFNQLINSYRIKEAITKLENGYLKEFTIDALWSEVGFSNRTTFYKKFKEYTGMTPMEFIKKNQASQNDSFVNRFD